MTYSTKNTAPRLVVVAAATLICSLQGCPSELTVTSTQDGPADILTEGIIVEAMVFIDNHGTLRATEVRLFGENEENDADTIWGCENYDEDETDDEDRDEHDWGGFTTRVDAIASDHESFVVFGGLKVVLEVEDHSEAGGDDDWDCTDEEDWDGEPGGLNICYLEPLMWIDVRGFTEDDKTFRATTIETADVEKKAILGKLQKLEDEHFTLLGLPIKFNNDTEIKHTDADFCK
ncbi:MAG: hypothetical protein GY854_17470 [Deltaproteobacteria bacterium]|nr:hypothetical protein [Deltaproteobacteria bacterium]